MNHSLSELVDDLSELGKNIPNGVLKERFYNVYQLYANGNKKFGYYYGKVFIHTNIWTHGINLINLYL